MGQAFTQRRFNYPWGEIGGAAFCEQKILLVSWAKINFVPLTDICRQVSRAREYFTILLKYHMSGALASGSKSSSKSALLVHSASESERTERTILIAKAKLTWEEHFKAHINCSTSRRKEPIRRELCFHLLAVRAALITASEEETRHIVCQVRSLECCIGRMAVGGGRGKKGRCWCN